MPNMTVREVSYTSEVTGQTSPIRFKIREDRANTPVIAYDIPNQVRCAGSAGFSPRAAVVEFLDGSTIRYPIPTRNDVPGVLSFFATDPTVACVHLDGEKWVTVPGVGNDVSYGLPDGFADKESGVMSYQSDVTGGILLVRAAFEIAPTALSDVARSCAETIKPIDPNGICSSTISGFKPRYFGMRAVNTTTDGQLNRKAPVADATEIITCRDAAGGVAPCIAYKGETVRNAHLYV